MRGRAAQTVNTASHVRSNLLGSPELEAFKTTNTQLRVSAHERKGRHPYVKGHYGASRPPAPLPSQAP